MTLSGSSRLRMESVGSVPPIEREGRIGLEHDRTHVIELLVGLGGVGVFGVAVSQSRVEMMRLVGRSCTCSRWLTYTRTMHTRSRFSQRWWSRQRRRVVELQSTVAACSTSPANVGEVVEVNRSFTPTDIPHVSNATHPPTSVESPNSTGN